MVELTETQILDRLFSLASDQSGIQNIVAGMAIYQDLRITGDDVDFFAALLNDEFGADSFSWPWGRFTNLNEPTMLTIFAFVWYFASWPFRGRLFPPSGYQRLELQHIAKVLVQGHWTDP